MHRRPWWPQRARKLQLSWRDVDRDDLRRSGDPHALHRVEPHAPDAGDDHGGSDGNASGVEHGAQSGRHAATDDGRELEVDVGVDLHHGVLVHEQHLREGAELAVLDHRGAVGEPEALLLDGRAVVVAVDADDRPAHHAVRALVTAPTSASEDVIPYLDAGDLRTDGLDDAGDLVAEDRRERMWPEPVEEEEVAVADACGRRPNEHLPTSRGSDGDRLEFKWRTHFVHDGGAYHLSSSVHLLGSRKLRPRSSSAAPGRSARAGSSVARPRADRRGPT